MTLDELIARLESATEGSDDLDEAIWTGLLASKGGRTAAMLGKNPQFGDLGFSRSIDAARALVPEGLDWLIGSGKSRPDEPLCGAIIKSKDGDDLGTGEHASSVAIALCVASLRARNVK